MGLSAGGHLSLLYSTYYTYNKDEDKMAGIKAVVAYYAPPSNLKDIFISENKSIFAKFATKQTLKGSPTKKKKYMIIIPPLLTGWSKYDTYSIGPWEIRYHRSL